MLRGGILLGSTLHEHRLHVLNGCYEKFLQTPFRHNSNSRIPSLGQRRVGCLDHKALGVTLFHGLLELNDAFALLRFLGVSMARYVHPSLASEIGPTNTAIGYNVVLPGDIDDAQVQLYKRLVPLGAACSRTRRGINMPPVTGSR